ncbi:MAG: GDP-mannose 4,6-dehydratase [Planctomycetes bacterium]|nr:GDP-mannose 4,6-dehydratase [Planctomycetota bacterium]
MSKDRRVLVTGGAGFIGNNFVRHLIERRPGWEITVLDSLTYAGRRDNLPPSPRIRFVRGDVRNPTDVDPCVQDADVVVHFAAESHVARSIAENRVFFETDVLGTQSVTSACQRFGVERLVHISTSEVYGTALVPRMDENHPLQPCSPYAAAKAGADRLVHSYVVTYGLPAVIIRPFNNYGPRQHTEKVIPHFITEALRGRPLTIHGDGSAERDWVSVHDHCRALLTAIEAPLDRVRGKVFNIGSGRSVPILGIARTLQALLPDHDVRIECGTDRPGQVMRHTADASRAREVLGWTPKIPLEEGLRDTVEWYLAHREWWERAPEGAVREFAA